MQALYQIITHQFFVTGFLAYMTSQVIKIIIGIIRTRHFSLHDLLFVQGGIPSSHSATVVSATTCIYLLEGPTNLFFLALLITFIVLIDASGVRRETGKQSRLMNRILQEKHTDMEFREELVENMGHTPLEVISGSIVGIIIAILINLIIT